MLFILPHEANICSGYFAFDRTQIVEMVTWLAQCRDKHNMLRFKVMA